MKNAAKKCYILNTFYISLLSLVELHNPSLMKILVSNFVDEINNG